MASVKLDEVQRARVRTLLFEELSRNASALADKADEASQLELDCDLNVHGDDANGMWRHGLQVTAELLDVIGWSVRTDGPTVRDADLARKRLDAPDRRNDREGGDA